jgi:hypothetical protein
LGNGQKLNKVDYFVFEGEKSFTSYLDEMKKIFNDYSTKIDNDLTNSLMDIVKSNVDIILSKKGGEGCVREFIDSYLLDQPLEN